MKIYNTLTKKKETFEPLTPGRVGMYVCGVTVYDDCHLGHARSAVVFDVISQYLRFRGLQVQYVRNFTDIDDKILEKARQEGISWSEVAEKYMNAYSRDMRRLCVTQPDCEPRATEHMADIIEMIKGLVEKRYAYGLDGDVYYEVDRYREYGSLSGRKGEELLAGARVEVNERKKNPMDFALWKQAKPGEPGWESPWGSGRPGWHIECSAMSLHHLGVRFDIHGGGKDLVFPHHENEIAQTCAYTGCEFARFWVHHGFVTIDQEKMSKSLGNFFTIRTLFEQSNCPEAVTAETLRYFLLSTHYRSDLNFSLQGVQAAKAALDNVYGLLQRLEESGKEAEEENTAFDQALKDFTLFVQQAMDDDFNTPKALAEFQRLRGEINGYLTMGSSKQAREEGGKIFRKVGRPFGLFQLSPAEWVFHSLLFRQEGSQPSDSHNLTKEWIDQQVQQREEARERKDFAKADHIRETLAAQGIVIEDRPDGTSRWKR